MTKLVLFFKQEYIFPKNAMLSLFFGILNRLITGDKLLRIILNYFQSGFEDFKHYVVWAHRSRYL